VARAPAAAPAVAAPFAAGTATVGSEYRVVRKDTLSSIAERAGAQTPAEINRLMVATFRANPEAFEGNINRLHKGALLRIPAAADLQGLSTREANREVSRQMSAWREAAGARAAGGEEARLRLVRRRRRLATGRGPCSGRSRHR